MSAGRPPAYRAIKEVRAKTTISAQIGGPLKIKGAKIKAIFESSARQYTGSSGGYIPISQDYAGHKVYVIVLEGKVL